MSVSIAPRKEGATGWKRRCQRSSLRVICPIQCGRLTPPDIREAVSLRQRPGVDFQWRAPGLGDRCYPGLATGPDDECSGLVMKFVFNRVEVDVTHGSAPVLVSKGALLLQKNPTIYWVVCHIKVPVKNKIQIHPFQPCRCTNRCLYSCGFFCGLPASGCANGESPAQSGRLPGRAIASLGSIQ